MGDVGRKESQHLVTGLIREATKQEDELAFSRSWTGRNRLCERTTAVWIVARVEQISLFLMEDPLITASRTTARDRLCKRFVRHAEALCLEDKIGRSSGRQALCEIKGMCRLSYRCMNQRGLGFLRAGGESLTRDRVLRSGNSGDVRPKDAGLLTRNSGERRAEPAYVVESDTRNHAEQRRAGVGRIQPASDAHLDNRDVNTARLKINKCHRRYALEKTGALSQRVGGLENAAANGEYACFIDGFIVDAYALRKAQQVRRGIKPHPASCGKLAVGKEAGGRAFAVGARDKHHAQMPLGRPQCVQKRTNPDQGELTRRRLAREQDLKEGRVGGSGGHRTRV